MSLASLLLFAAVYAVAVATPGPGITAIVARVMARGLAGAPAFIAGFVVGDLVWLVLAVTGLSVIATAFAPLFLVIKWAGVAFLAFLAWRMWTAPAAVAAAGAVQAAESPLRLFLASLALTLGNPKVMIFFLAILPTVIDLKGLSLADAFRLALVGTCVITFVLTCYALLAAQARRLVQTPRAMQIVNRVCGATIAGAAAAIAAR